MLCPTGMTCVTNGTVIDIMFTLAGCLDRLGEVKYTAIENATTRSLDVSVYALGITNPKSASARCIRAQTANYKITLINKYGTPNVKFLKKKQTI